MVDKSKIQKILSLNDEDLRKKVTEAAITAGADKYMTAIALSDMDKLRTMLGNLSEEQISALVEKIGKDTADEIAKKLNNM